MLFQNRLNDFALHADSPAVDDANFTKAALDGLIKVLLNHDLNLPRLESMQIDRVFDRNLVHSIQYNHVL